MGGFAAQRVVSGSDAGSVTAAGLQDAPTGVEGVSCCYHRVCIAAIRSSENIFLTWLFKMNVNRNSNEDETDLGVIQ